MRLGDLFRVGQLAEIDLGQVVGARGAFPAALTAAIALAVFRGWNLIGRGIALRAPPGRILHAFEGGGALFPRGS